MVSFGLDRLIRFESPMKFVEELLSLRGHLILLRDGRERGLYLDDSTSHCYVCGGEVLGEHARVHELDWCEESCIEEGNGSLIWR